MHVHVFLASWLDPFTNIVAYTIGAIDTVVHNRGWSLVLFALVLKLITWPLNVKQFKAFLKMQELGPQIKALQNRNKQKEEQLERKIKDPAQLKQQKLELQQSLQKDTMALYSKNGANPLAGCWPMLITYPFFAGVYFAVTLPHYRPLYEGQHWLWIGSAISAHAPYFAPWKNTILAGSLTAPDLALLVMYAISMYFFSRYGTVPSTDPQQAQTQKMMAYVMPVMFGYIGFQAKWPSAMVLYWLCFNLFNMAQQFYMLRRYHKPLSVLDNEHAVTDVPDAPAPAAKGSNGAASQQPSRPKNRTKKKGAKT